MEGVTPLMHLACPGLNSSFENGATIVTPTRVLAEIARQQLTRRKLDQDLHTWERAPVYHVDAWLAACWQEARYKTLDAPALLSRSQEHALWKQIVESEHAHLFDSASTAGLAMQAAKLIREWHIPAEGDAWSDYEDAQQFQRWNKIFQRKCREQGWIARADLWRLLPKWISQGVLNRELTVFAGFHEFTPALEDVKRALGLFASVERFESSHSRSRAVVLRCDDEARELERAARWARAAFEQNPARSIGVFVPDLSTRRALVERTFQNVFYPSAALNADRTDSVFHVNASAPLKEHPLVASALLLLELLRPRVAIADAGAILRCPFIAGAAAERNARALADIELRRRRDLDVGVRDLEFAAKDCRMLAPVWQHVQRVLSNKRGRLDFSAWSELFAGLLQVAGWPGDVELNAAEQEITEAWKQALSEMAALGLVSEPVSYGAALTYLRRLLLRPGIERGDWSSPVQILDSSDASGIQFDEALLTGLGEESWPPPLNANPLVPLKLQRVTEIASSSPEKGRRERERLTESLFAAARAVSATYSGRLSPIAAAFVTPVSELPQWPGKLPRDCYARQDLMELEDSKAPPYTSKEPVRGGTAIVKEQSQCPFRAFAEFRLAARTPEDACFGFDARDRGGFLHKALQFVWGDLRTQDRLRAMPEDELQVLVEKAVKQAVKEYQSSPFHELITITERERLQELILEWLQIERNRKMPFTVELVEEKRSYELGGLPLQLRLDRIDRLRNGSLVLIDYKSGKQSFKSLEGPRPKEPQLLVYAASCGEPVEGIFFAQLKARELRGVGFSRDVHFPGRSAQVKRDWDSFLDASQAEVERIASEFVRGNAAVDPIRGACEYCRVEPFCRVNERPRQEQEAE